MTWKSNKDHYHWMLSQKLLRQLLFLVKVELSLMKDELSHMKDELSPVKDELSPTNDEFPLCNKTICLSQTYSLGRTHGIRTLKKGISHYRISLSNFDQIEAIVALAVRSFLPCKK